jgi:hypothetical protein
VFCYDRGRFVLRSGFAGRLAASLHPFLAALAPSLSPAMKAAFPMNMGLFCCLIRDGRDDLARVFFMKPAAGLIGQARC